MPFIFTNRAGNPDATDFEIEDFFTFREEKPTVPWSSKDRDHESVQNHFGYGSNYQGLAQLRESPEYHEAAAERAEAQGTNVNIYGIKAVQQSRGSQAISKTNREDIGWDVLNRLEAMIPDDKNKATKAWVDENVESLFSAVGSEWSPSAKPVKPVKATQAEKLKAAEEKYEKVAARLKDLGIELDDDPGDIEF